jgi:streptogramin lyase/mono/diheme cytochrome c family protein
MIARFNPSSTRLTYGSARTIAKDTIKKFSVGTINGIESWKKVTRNARNFTLKDRTIPLIMGALTPSRGLSIWSIALLVAIFSLPLPAAQKGTVSGLVKNASGQPASGAFVKVSSSDSNVTYMIVSQTDGRYRLPGLAPGTYGIQGFGGRYQSESVEVAAIADRNSAARNLVLSVPRIVNAKATRRTPADYLAMFPEGDGKAIVMNRCMSCHGVELIAPVRSNRDAWGKTLARMNLYWAARADLQQDQHLGPMSQEEVDVILSYLSKNFGPDSPPLSGERIFAGPDDNLPLVTRVSAEPKFVEMELNQRTSFQVYDLTVDSRGAVWVSGRKGPASTVGKVADRREMDRMNGETARGALGRFDPQLMSVIPIPLPAEESSSVLGAIAADPEGNIWISDRDPKSSHWYEYKPNDQKFQLFEIPLPWNLPAAVLREPVNVNTFRFLDGDVWGVANPTSRVLKLDPRTGKITQYPVPLGSHPHGFAIGGDGAIWYAAVMDREVVRLDPSDGDLRNYATNLPLAGYRMAADRDGNLWIVTMGGTLAKVEYRSGRITEFNIPAKNSRSYAIAVDTKRNFIWFDETDAGKLGRFDPAHQTFAEFPLPSAEIGYIIRLVVDPTDSTRVWWSAPGEIGWIEVTN